MTPPGANAVISDPDAIQNHPTCDAGSTVASADAKSAAALARARIDDGARKIFMDTGIS